MTHSAENDALAVVPLRVNREHEDAPWGCSCGAKFGDGIDRRWHLMNETVKATLAYVIPPADGDKDCTAAGFSGEGRCIEPAVRAGLCAEHLARRGGPDA